MNRFGKKENKILHFFQTKILYIFFILILVVFLIATASIGSTNKAKQLESLESALEKSIIQCYAVEGTYPPNLDYIIDHYGLTYDEDTFFIDYISIGSNIMPDYTIILK